MTGDEEREYLLRIASGQPEEAQVAPGVFTPLAAQHRPRVGVTVHLEGYSVVVPQVELDLLALFRRGRPDILTPGPYSLMVARTDTRPLELEVRGTVVASDNSYFEIRKDTPR